MNSRENQVLNLLLIEYIFSKKTGRQKTETKGAYGLRIHRRLSTILKTSKKVYELMFFDM